MRAIRITATTLLVLALSAGPAGAQVTEVVVGVTPTCPYGLKACWGGAHEALSRLTGVKSVAAAPGADDCVGLVLAGDGLPDPDAWAAQFKERVDRAYLFRGVEVTVVGEVRKAGDGLTLHLPGRKEAVAVVPLGTKIQWDTARAAARRAEPAEREAFTALASAANNPVRVRLTGPLRKTAADGYAIEVRRYEPADRVAPK